jgi:hypothetical protein
VALQPTGGIGGACGVCLDAPFGVDRDPVKTLERDDFGANNDHRRSDQSLGHDLRVGSGVVANKPRDKHQQAKNTCDDRCGA